MTNDYTKIVKEYANVMDKSVLADVIFAAGTLTCLSSDLISESWSKKNLKEETLLAIADMYICLGKLSAYYGFTQDEVEEEVNLAIESMGKKIGLR